VISFSIRANHFSWVCLFCIFVRNRIYVIEIEVLEPVFMARKHKSGKAPILMLDCMISQVLVGFDNLNISKPFLISGFLRKCLF
jgi:hypothetical protein